MEDPEHNEPAAAADNLVVEEQNTKRSYKRFKYTLDQLKEAIDQVKLGKYLLTGRVKCMVFPKEH